MSQVFKYVTSTSGVTSLADTGDWFQLRNGASCIVEILEIRVFQHVETDIQLNGIRLARGVGGAAGTGLTEYDYDVNNPAPVATAFSLPTTDVGTLDLEIRCGWNILQEFVWLPTPEIQIILHASDHLGIAPIVADAIAGVGCSITWQERRSA